MRYENIKTGAVIDSPFIIKGNLWVPIDNGNQHVTDLSVEELRALVLEQQSIIDEYESKLNEPKTENEETNTDDAEEIEEEIELQDMTNKELEQFAKEQGVELSTDDKRNKETRIAAIVTALG